MTFKRPLLSSLLLSALFSGTLAEAEVRELHFNWDPERSFVDPRGIHRIGADFQQVLIENIRKSKSSIEMAVYNLNLPDVAKELVAKHRSGVQVRVIVDDTNREPISDLLDVDPRFLSQEQLDHLARYISWADLNGDGRVSQEEILQTQAMAMLRAANVPVQDDTADGSAGSGIMHHKFVIVDRKTVLTGSANFTHSDFFGNPHQLERFGNSNSMMVVDSRDMAAAFYEEFSIMWGEGGEVPAFGLRKPFRAPQHFRFSDGTELRLQFGPRSADLIHDALAEARKQVDVALFVFSAQNISNQLENFSRQGGLVRALVDGGFAYRWYSEILDMLGLELLDHRCRVQADNRPWRRPIATVGSPRMPAGDKFHHKYAVIDNESVIYGSYNWSANAENNNDETLMHIRSHELAPVFREEFERHYANAYLGVTPWLERRVAEHNNTCVPY